MLGDASRPLSPRCKSPDKSSHVPVLVVDSPNEMVDDVFLAARPDIAVHDARIAALLLFGKANMVSRVDQNHSCLSLNCL